MHVSLDSAVYIYIITVDIRNWIFNAGYLRLNSEAGFSGLGIQVQNFTN
jgi:hypothetical protein